ncbi:hypothetical protein N7450_008906 [Penicillium hetheringtonii]|uniref:NmrA-like domain-containing protein n=1 Tax=Penicillium hetheringtonii TaxID=911720 RepID=A0AAD6GNR7_9EURO|nr:hypothetical protein N7450_008906 [Penicillium hetheringtonii]
MDCHHHWHIEVLESPDSVLPRKIQVLGIKIHLVDLEDSSNLVSIITGFDTLINVIGPNDLVLEKKVLQPAKLAGIKGFVPCAFSTLAPPQGVTLLRDEREEIYNEIKSIVIDVDYEYPARYPIIPFGGIDSNLMPETKIYGDGTAPNILTNVPDIGRFVARIIQSDRTLNRYVYTYGDVLSQKEAIQIGKEIIGMKVERKHI